MEGSLLSTAASRLRVDNMSEHGSVSDGSSPTNACLGAYAQCRRPTLHKIWPCTTRS